MKKTYTVDISIQQPLERVLALFEDLDGLARWQPGFIGHEPMDGEPGHPGSRTRLRYRHGKKELDLIETIEVNDLPREFTARFDTDGMSMRVKNSFAADGPAETRWHTENEAEIASFFFKVMAVLMPGCFRRQSAQFMQNFKAWVEDGTDIREAG